MYNEECRMKNLQKSSKSMGRKTGKKRGGEDCFAECIMYNVECRIGKPAED